jgi:CRISPR-associated protein Cmr6
MIVTTESRFVTGLGRRHPVDNGFAWHPTLGVPYLPGSSVKGLVRSWVEHDAEPHTAQADVERLFGKRRAPHDAGSVVFLDAVPIAPVHLEVDVMTPHYTGWTPDKPPGDWREPVPVPFLVVAPRTAFLFSVMPRGIEQGSLADVGRWLREALVHAGAGAKTAVGYGRFAYDDARTQAWLSTIERTESARMEESRRATLRGTPEGKWLDQLAGKPERAVLDLVRMHLEAQPLTDPVERRAFARAVATTPFLALWRRGETQDRRNIRDSRDKLKARARLVDTACEPSR